MAILKLSPASLTSDLEDAIDYRFLDKALLHQALSHRSVERRGLKRVATKFGPVEGALTSSNERLEFLGDSILGFLVTKVLFRASPSLSEGSMSRVRSNLVKNESLARKARLLNIPTHLRMDDRELRQGLADESGPLADAMEALIGAVFLDGGIDSAERVVSKIFKDELSGDLRTFAGLDAKSELIMIARKRGLGLVIFNSDERRGGRGDSRHTISVVLEGRRGRPRFIARAEGPSRRKAEQDAAIKAIQKLTGGHGGEAGRRSRLDPTRGSYVPSKASDRASRETPINAGVSDLVSDPSVMGYSLTGLVAAAVMAFFRPLRLAVRRS
jgi:ribonuclease-3